MHRPFKMAAIIMFLIGLFVRPSVRPFVCSVLWTRNGRTDFA